MENRTSAFFASLLLLIGPSAACDDTAACDGGTCKSSDAGDGSTDGTVDAAAPSCQGPPGLYVEGSCTTLAAGIRSYAPAYALWSDGAAKQRYVYLPPGQKIDTSNPDAWVYPVGTRFYKHFDFNNRHVETRLLEKTGTGEGPTAWSFRTFLWDVPQTAVAELTSGAIDVVGTSHDIPPTSACPQCHAAGGGGSAATSGMRDVGLSFTAIQLNHSATGVSLTTLIAEGRLTNPISAAAAVIPGDDSVPVEKTARAAIGYLHANCGPCHNGASAPPGGSAALRFWVPVGTTALEQTPAYLTAVSQPAVTWTLPGETLRVAPQDPTHSMLIERISRRGVDADSGVSYQMPPLATEIVDSNAIATISAWITALPAP